jgi:hypothetical protein
MVRDQVSKGDEVLFSTSYGPYIPWHILHHADRRHRHGRSFFDNCLDLEQQQLRKNIIWTVSACPLDSFGQRLYYVESVRIPYDRHHEFLTCNHLFQET